MISSLLCNAIAVFSLNAYGLYEARLSRGLDAQSFVDFRCAVTTNQEFEIGGRDFSRSCSCSAQDIGSQFHFALLPNRDVELWKRIGLRNRTLLSCEFLKFRHRQRSASRIFLRHGRDALFCERDV